MINELVHGWRLADPRSWSIVASAGLIVLAGQ